jgi:hypothetical protein
MGGGLSERRRCLGAEGVDAEAVFSWMDTYCRAHPLVILGEAAEAFVQEHPDR